jgi:hypothetical protein
MLGSMTSITWLPSDDLTMTKNEDDIWELDDIDDNDVTALNSYIV